MIKACGAVLVLGFLASGYLGCGSTEMTATGPAAAPRAETCDFEILTSTPLIGYREIGTVDVTPGPYGVNQFTSLSDFKAHIQPNVCKLGGDAAIASANGFGMYIKASVMKRVEVEAAPPAPAPVAAAPKPVSHGCEFDSQCKGDRICVEGKCEAPTASAPPTPPAPVAAATAAPAVESASVAAVKPAAPAPAKAAAKSAH